MRKLSVSAFIALISIMFVMACGETETNEKDDEGNADLEQNDDATSDTKEAVDEDEVADSEPVVLAYPENVTPTSKTEGDIASNLEFYDELDSPRHLAEWYKENNKESKIIWLIFSTYDCPACMAEKSDIHVFNGKYSKKGLKTILIMNGLLSGPKASEEPGKIAVLKEALVSMEGESANHTYGYLKKQTEFKKFIKQGYPVNVFLDASTMEVIKHLEGWESSDGFLRDIDNFLETMLDML